MVLETLSESARNIDQSLEDELLELLERINQRISLLKIKGEEG